LRRYQGEIPTETFHAETITIKNNRLTALLNGATRGHDRVDKFVALGEIDAKSAAQAEYDFLEYTGHKDLLNE
jgi:hypothetical protein